MPKIFDTDPALEIPKYRYKVSIDGRYITIINPEGKQIERSRGACEVMAASTGNPEAVREMYRGALEAFGAWVRPEEDTLTETIATICGIKVYFDPFKLRFFAKISGKPIRDTILSSLERKIIERRR